MSDWIISAEGGLWSVAAVAFLAATVLPVPSEAALAGYLLLHPDRGAVAWLVAGLANTAGGMTTWAVGRWLSTRVPGRLEQQLRARLRRWGAPALLLAWVPVLGDALVLGAGWLRLHPLACLLWQALGRFARYALVVHGMGGGFPGAG
jgi:membrane protein YqaA with SNARE-associated domain